jgi:hypothetical protein
VNGSIFLATGYHLPARRKVSQPADKPNSVPFDSRPPPGGRSLRTTTIPLGPRLLAGSSDLPGGVGRAVRRATLVRPVMDERVTRLWAGAEADALGDGGIAIVTRATGLSRTTIRAGRDELRRRRPSRGRRILTGTTSSSTSTAASMRSVREAHR